MERVYLVNKTVERGSGRDGSLGGDDNEDRCWCELNFRVEQGALSLRGKSSRGRKLGDGAGEDGDSTKSRPLLGPY